MFLIADDQDRVTASLGKMRSRLIGYDHPCGEIVLWALGERWLGWFSCKPGDNLHIFSDGLLIGKRSFAEAPVPTAQLHDSALPADLSPLLQAAFLRWKPGEDVVIVPHKVTNVFVSGTMVSDMQLMLADAGGFLPNAPAVAVFSACRYFPGNDTLFQEVTRIPYMYAYHLNSKTFQQVESFTYRANDDEAMLERLASVLPRDVENYLLISGGYDSRLLAACFRRAGLTPRLVHWKSEEAPLVEQLVAQMGVPLMLVDEYPRPSPAEFTLLTDAQVTPSIINRQYLKTIVPPNAVWHTGDFGEALTRLFQPEPLRPEAGSTFFQRLILDLLEVPRERIMVGVRDYAPVQEIVRYLEGRLDYIRDYCPRFTDAELLRWFFFVNSGLRWSAGGSNGDATFWSQPAYPYSDQIALEYAISSSLYANLAHERIRLMLARELPEVTVGYTSGRPQLSRPELASPVRKLYHWLAIRYRPPVVRKGAKTKKVTYPGVQHRRFEQYFRIPLELLLSSQESTLVEKRAAISMNEVLHLLEP